MLHCHLCAQTFIQLLFCTQKCPQVIRLSWMFHKHVCVPQRKYLGLHSDNLDLYSFIKSVVPSFDERRQQRVSPRQFEHINLSKTKWCQSLSCGPCIPLRPVSMAMPVHLCRASLSGGTPRDLGRECKRERWGLGGRGAPAHASVH